MSNIILKPEGYPDMTNLDFSEARWRALSGFGIERPSGDMKRDLDEHKKVLIQRGLNIRQAIAAPDMGTGIVQFVASTDGIKRDGNRVSNDGWTFSNFSQNPVFLWCHDYRLLPIGKHLSWRVDKEDGKSVLRIWVQFAPKELNEFADKVRLMYEHEYLRAVSIGWIPLEYEPILDSDGDWMGWNFTKNDLLEVSAVPVPSDPEAVKEAQEARIISAGDLERMTQWGVLPQLSRKIAYTISHIDREVQPESIEQKDAVDQEPQEASIEDKTLVPEAPVVTNEPETEETRTEPEPQEENKETDVNINPEDRGVNAETEDPLARIQSSLDDLSRSFITGIMDTIRSVIAAQPVANDDLRSKASEESHAEVTTENTEQVAEERSEELPTEQVDSQEDAQETSQETENRSIDDVVISRIGSRLSKDSKDKLGKCRSCLDEAMKHIGELIDDEENNNDDDDKEEVKKDTPEIPSENPQHYALDDELLEKLNTIRSVFGLVEEDKQNPEEVVEVDPELLQSRLAGLVDAFNQGVREKKTTTQDAEPKSKFVGELFQKLELVKKSFS
jgi:hypothetical protein